MTAHEVVPPTPGKFLLAFAIALGALACAGASDREVRERRIHEQLGLAPPFRLLGIAFLDDGGTGTVSIADDHDTIHVWEDNRLFATGPSEFGRVEPPIPRHVWLGAHPRFPGSRELAYGSPAESAVVDLLHLQVQSLVSAREESTLVRDERKARTDRHPSYAREVWRSKLSPDEWNVMQLRMLIDQIEFRRSEAAKGAP
jgi:hypothetical protein